MDYNQSLQTERRRKARFLFVSISALLVAGTGAIIYTVFFTNLFRFDGIIVRGTSIISKEELFSGKPLPYLFGSVNVSSPLVASVKINKNIFHKILTLDIEERKPFGVWCNSHDASSTLPEHCLWFDHDGFLFAPAPATLGILVKSIYEVNGRELTPGAYVLPVNALKYMFSIFGVLDSAQVGVTKSILPDLKSQELHAVTPEGTLIYFSLRLDPAFTLEALKSLKSKLGEIQYIDFRSENRVFYK